MDSSSDNRNKGAVMAVDNKEKESERIKRHEGQHPLTRVNHMHVALGGSLDDASKDVNVGACVDVGCRVGEAREWTSRQDLARDPGPG